METMEKVTEMGAGAPGRSVEPLMETTYYKRGEEEEEDMEEDDIQRNEVLSSIAGGLQAFSRQKGGFGFRFGRK